MPDIQAINTAVYRILAGSDELSSRCTVYKGAKRPGGAVNPAVTVDTKRLEPGEYLSLRTEQSVTVQTKQGTRHTQVYSRNKYYRDGSVLLAADVESRPDNSGLYTMAVEAGAYTYRYNPSDTQAGSCFEVGDTSVSLCPAGDWTGKASTVEPVSYGVKETILFSPGASPEISWMVSSDAVITFRDGALVFCGRDGDFLFYVPPAVAEDAAGKDVPVFASFSGDTLTYRIAPCDDTVFPVLLDPTISITTQQDGYITSANAVYTVAHDSLSGSGIAGHNIQVGQNMDFQIFRSFLSFPVPEMGTVMACSLYLEGAGDYSTDDFEIYILGASEYGPEFEDDDFPRFDGHQSSGAYNGTVLNEMWNTASYVSGWNAVEFNAAGRDSVLAAAGDTIRIAIISKEDYLHSIPASNEYVKFDGSLDDTREPYLSIEYLPAMKPLNFTMAPVDTAAIACSWTDNSDNEQCFLIMSLPDSTVIDTVAANAVTDTVYNLGANTKHTWIAVADSAGLRGYSDPDSCYTLLPEPRVSDILVRPISSDTLRVTIVPPPNGQADSTGMEIDAISGSGGSDSGWMNGEYSYFDSGVTGGSTYIYRLRMRNGIGVATEWSPQFSYEMHSLDSLTVYLAGDSDDDYTLDGGPGENDETAVRVGAGDNGEILDGFWGFNIPWEVQKGGVDSLQLRISRIDESSDNTVSLNVFGVPDKYLGEIESIDPGTVESTEASIAWEVSSGVGSKASPNLRALFREWQEISPVRDRLFRFGVRLDSGTQADSVRAVFLDASNPLYENNTSLTFYYTPGNPDTLECAPADMLIEVNGPDSLTVSWTDMNAGEAGFVLMDCADSMRVAGTDTLAHDTASVGVGGLVPNTVYQWFVRAFTGGESMSSDAVSARTEARTPGKPSVIAVSDSTIRFVLDPLDNPFYTQFAVQDSVSGFYVDSTGDPATLRVGPPEEWAWRTYFEWGGLSGDTLGVFGPDSLLVIRAKARDGQP